MAAPTCIRCDRPFPANHELSTLPEGRRVALDIDRGRVWRICTVCGEWNLLSPESAGQVLPELDRLATSLPTEVMEQGVSRSRKDLLEIVRIGVSPGTLRDPGIVERHAKVTRRRNKIAMVGVAAIALILTMPFWFGPEEIVGRGMALRSIAALCGTIWSAQLFGRIPRTRRIQPGSGATELLLGSLMLGMAILASADRSELGMHLSTSLMLTLLWIWIDRGLPFGWTRLASGGKVWVRRRELDETRVRVDEGGNLRLTLPNGRILDVDDSAAVLRDLLDGYSWETTAEAQKIAATLVPDVDALPAIIEILRPAMEADPNGVQLIRLPPAWRAALDLALAADTGRPGRLSSFAIKAREAQQVAAIAETLDEPAT